MKKKHLEIFEKQLVKIKEDYNKIINDKENKCDKLEKLKKIIDKCNIIEEYNIEYLKELNSVEDENNFKQNLKKYEGSISSKLINENFEKYKNIINKIDALDKIKLLIFSIVNLKTLSLLEQTENLKNIFNEIKSQKVYKLNFQLLPSDNLELYLYNLYQIFCSNIYDKINELKANHFDDYEAEEEKLSDKKMAKEIALMTDEYKKLKNDINNKDNKDNKEKEIKELDLKISLKTEEYKLFQIIHSNYFKKYINGFNKFYSDLSCDLNKKFFKNNNLNESDIKLFEKFIHTLSNYDFHKLNKHIIKIWKESLEELSIQDIKNELKKYNSNYFNFRLINDNKDLQLKYDNGIINIEHIKQYSLNPLIRYLIYKDGQININNFDLNFELIKYLKIQYFSEYIHKNILNDKWKKFYYDVFDSKTIKSLISIVHQSAKNITKEVFIDIIDSINFFNFYCSNLGQSYPLHSIFISGIIQKNEVEPLEIVKYYIRIYIIILHEILGHILIFLIGSLYDKNIQSPQTKSNIYSKTARSRGKESEEYLHVKLFGKLLKKLTINELCFIFNIKNYSEENYENFTINFSNCNNEKEYEIPDNLSEIFKNIKINELEEIPIEIYASKEFSEIEFNILDYNENYCKIIDILDFKDDDFEKKFDKYYSDSKIN